MNSDLDQDIPIISFAIPGGQIQIGRFLSAALLNLKNLSASLKASYPEFGKRPLNKPDSVTMAVQLLDSIRGLSLPTIGVSVNAFQRS